MNSRTRKWRRRGTEALVVVAVFLGVRAYQQAGLAEGQAPPLNAATVQGGTVRIPAEMPTLVYFWGTWCPVCAAEKGAVNAVASDHPVVSVAMQSGTDAEVAAHIRDEGIAFPVINDADGRLAAAWGVRTVPALFVIDSRGGIRHREVGYTTAPGLRLRLWLAR